MEDFDFSRAPFRLDSQAAGPQQVARDITACFGVISGLPRKTTQSFDAAVRAIGLDPQEPVAQAGHRIAETIDAGTGDGRGNPYHNSQHFCEVLMGALAVSWLAALPPGEQSLLLLAALAHDFHHDGRDARNAPFRLERIAVAQTLPFLAAAGAPVRASEIITAMILATEVSRGVPYARQCYRHFFAGEERPRAPDGVEGLALLAEDARAAQLAVLLTEADVLPSVGLTPECGEESQLKLSREWGRALGAADKLYFLERVFGDFTVSRYFSPNLERMKRAMRQRGASLQ